MYRTGLITLTAVTVGLMAPPAAGQAQTQPGAQPPRQNQQQPEQRDRVDTQMYQFQRVSEITGTEVHGLDDRNVGTVDYLLVDAHSGKSKFAVVRSGGVLGIGGTRTPVPMQALTFGLPNQPIRINMTEQQFEAAPSFEWRDWERINDEQWRNSLYQHYGVQKDKDMPAGAGSPQDRDARGGAADRGAPPPPGTTGTGAQDRTQPGKPADRVHTDKMHRATVLMRSNDIKGSNVRNLQDENLGNVDDLIVDLREAQVKFIVLGHGGVLGIGETLYAIPWQSFRYDARQEEFVLNIAKDRLEQAPRFTRQQWPNLRDDTWTREIHVYHGTSPDWVYGFDDEEDFRDDRDWRDRDMRDDRELRDDREMRDRDRRDQQPRDDRGLPGARDMGVERDRAWMHDSQYNRNFQAGNVEQFTGTIENMERFTPMQGASEGVQLNLRSQQGQTIAVHLGPAWFIDRQRVEFNRGDQVTVTGCRAQIEGRTAVMAAQVRHNNNVLVLRQQDGMPIWDAYRPAGQAGQQPGQPQGADQPRSPAAGGGQQPR